MALDRDAAIITLDELQPSPFVAEHLPGATLTADLVSSEGAERVTLSLSWDEPGRQAAPVSLVAWLPRDAASAEATEAVAEEETP